MWTLEDLFVEAGYRGRGVATALLHEAAAQAVRSGASGLYLETAFDNQAAQRVYKRTGWTLEDRFCKYNAPLG